jgi:hypothetical protein
MVFIGILIMIIIGAITIAVADTNRGSAIGVTIAISFAIGGLIYDLTSPAAKKVIGTTRMVSVDTNAVVFDNVIVYPGDTIYFTTTKSTPTRKWALTGYSNVTTKMLHPKRD